jgi:hypothetical protein
MISQSKRWLRLVDQASGASLAVAGAGLTVLFAFAYWLITKVLPEHGIQGTEPGAEFDMLAAVYFSIVTETTLGYGDYRPLGISRVLVSIHVLLGLGFAGIIVAKITSARGSSVRLVSYKSSGDWVEIGTMPDSGIVLFTHVIIFHDGDILRYDGENFDSEGKPEGFFTSLLIDGEGELLRFSYTNRDSTGKYFKDGIASLLFQGHDKEGRWNRYHGTAHDFGTKETIVYEGMRCSDEEKETLGGTNFSARANLIRKYIPPRKA